MKGCPSFILVIISMIFFIACSGPKDQGTSITDPNKSETQKLITLPTQLALEVDQIDFSCLNGQCPNYTGLVVAGQADLTWRCTGFLVDDLTLITAQHCLPQQLQHLEQSCEGHLEFILPETVTSAQERLQCDKVIGLNSMEWRPYDYVVLKLKERPNRRLQTIRLNQGPRYHGQSVDLWRIQSHSLTRVTLDTTRCQLNNQSLLSLYFDSPHSALIQYSNCQTTQGHSGGPLLNLQGEIIGIHSSSIKETSNVAQSFASLTPRGIVQEVGQATNLGCLCRVGEHWRPCTTPSSCLKSYSDEQMLQQRLRVLDRTIRPLDQRRQISALERLRQDLSGDYFEWEYSLSFIRNQFFTTLRPRCLKRQFHVNDLPWRSDKRLYYREHLICQTRLELADDLSVNQLTIPTEQQCQNVALELHSQGEGQLTLRMQHLMPNSPIDEIIPIDWCTF
jgi:hypothetical protein